MNNRDFLAALIDHKVAQDGVWLQVCRFVLDPSNPVVQLAILLREIETSDEYCPFNPTKKYPTSAYSHQSHSKGKEKT